MCVKSEQRGFSFSYCLFTDCDIFQYVTLQCTHWHTNTVFRGASPLGEPETYRNACLGASAFEFQSSFFLISYPKMIVIGKWNVSEKIN